MSVPTRQTPQGQVDAWNAQLRQSPAYLDFMRRNGLPTDGRVKLSGSQQSALERALAASGSPIPKGMHIDQGGNLNQKNTLVRNVGIGAAIGAGTLATAGALGAGPLAGLLGGGGATTTMVGGVPVVAGVGPGVVAPTVAGGAVAGKGLSSSVLGLIGALTQTGTGLIGAKMQANAGRDAAQLQDRYLREALEFAKQQDALDRANYAEERARLWGREDARDARLAPFRGYGTSAGAPSLAALLTGPPQRASTMAPSAQPRQAMTSQPSGNGGGDPRFNISTPIPAGDGPLYTDAQGNAYERASGRRLNGSWGPPGGANGSTRRLADLVRG